MMLLSHHKGGISLTDTRSVSDYVSLVDYAKEHGYSDRGIYLAKLCRAGKIEGAIMMGKRWIIPADTVLPDRRVKTGKYVGWRDKFGKTPYPNIKANDEDGVESPK